MTEEEACALRQYEKTMTFARAFQARMEAIIHRLNIPEDRRGKLLALLGLEGHCRGLLASDLELRQHSIMVLNRIVTEFMTDGLDDSYKVWLGTFATETGLTGDEDPHLQIEAVKIKIDRIIRDMDYSALVFLEVQPLINYPTHGRNSLLLHGHLLGWGKAPERKRRAAILKARNSKAWANEFGAPPILLKSPRLDLGGAPGFACYMTKTPSHAKRLEANENGDIRFANHRVDYPDGLALRVMEGLSHVSMLKLVFGVNDGKHLRSKWCSAIRGWSKSRDAHRAPLPEFDVHEVWDDLSHVYYRRHGYRPYRID